MRILLPLLATCLAVAACTKRDLNKDLNQLDAELVANGAGGDAAMRSALEDPILADPTLARQADGRALHNAPDAGRMPLPSAAMLAAGATAPDVTGLSHAPEARAVPCASADCGGREITLGELAKAQAAGMRGGALLCAPGLAYGFAWAGRLPAALPVYPQAQVAEAAGADTPGCHVRVVSFATPATRQAVTDYYYTRAVRAGFSADHMLRGGKHVLAGTRGDDAYYLMLADRGGGTAVDMIVRSAP